MGITNNFFANKYGGIALTDKELNTFYMLYKIGKENDIFRINPYRKVTSKELDSFYKMMEVLNAWNKLIQLSDRCYKQNA